MKILSRFESILIDALKVGVFEGGWVLEAVAQDAVEANVSEPDEREG